VLVPRYKLSLCHTPIKPDLLGFPGIGVFACGLHDHVITRFASVTLALELIFIYSTSRRLFFIKTLIIFVVVFFTFIDNFSKICLF